MPEFELKRFFNSPLAGTARANLSPSFAEPLGTADLLALESGAGERLTSLALGYTAAFGAGALAEAIAQRYTRIAPDQVLAGCGADDVLSSLFMALLEPGAGERVIVHAPVYGPLTSVATWLGADVVLWQADEAAGWEPSLDHLADLLRIPTRMVVVNVPHSPTGYVPERAWLDRLCELTDQAGCLLIGDEIYRGLPLTSAPEAPSLADISPRAVVLNSVSKTYGLPGLRVGWLATRNQSVLDAVRAFRLHQNSYLGAPVEFLAALALRHTDTILIRHLARARENASLLDAFLTRHADIFSYVPPGGGVVAFPRWLGEESTTVLSERLLRDHRLLLAPSAYFAGGDRHVRIGFGTAAFPDGLAMLENALYDLTGAAG